METRTLRLLGAATAPRLETVDGVEYVVVPVIAMTGNSVIHAVNSDHPEFVPTEALSADGWEDRPCCAGHPHDGTTQVPITTPGMLERYSVGFVRHAVVQNSKLMMDAYLSRERASTVGSHAVQIVERAKAGDAIEISLGAAVHVEPGEGVSPSGQRYNGRWTAMRPDHLAVFPRGLTGACSIKMGCGANRAAAVNVYDGMTFRAAQEVKATSSPWQRVLRAMKALTVDRAAASLSDTDLRDEIAEALRESVPGFAYVYAVYPLDSQVVYTVAPIGPRNYGYDPIPVESKFFRRTFTAATNADGDVDVTLGDDAEEVERAPEEFVAAQAAWVADRLAEHYETSPGLGDVTIRTAAGREMSAKNLAHAQTMHDTSVKLGATCPEMKAAQSATSAAVAAEEMTMTKTELIAAILATPSGAFTAADMKFLESRTECQLKVLQAAPPTVPDAQAIADKAIADFKAAQAARTEDEQVAALPASLRSLVARSQAEDAARRTALLTSLKTAQRAYSETELAAKSTDELVKIAALAKASVPAVDFAALGAPRVPADGDGDGDEDDYAPPDPYAAGIKALQASRVQ